MGTPGGHRVCESCGMLTAMASPWCDHCGEASEKLLRLAAERQKEKNFDETILARPAAMTVVFLASNVLAFIVLLVHTKGVYNPDDPLYAESMIRFGALIASYVGDGEWWRLICPIFLHFGPIHLLLNSFALWQLGPQVERLYGATRFTVFYLVAGITGSLASYLFESMNTYSAGASGAIFGLTGVMVVFSLKHRSEIPPKLRHVFGFGPIAVTLIMNLYMGWAIPNIGNIAHMGGLVGGAALATMVPYQRKRAPASRAWLAAAAALLVLPVAAFGFVWSSPHREMPTSAFAEQFNRTHASLDVAVASLDVDAARGDASLAERTRAASAEAVAARGLDARSRDLLRRSGLLLERISSVAGPNAPPLSAAERTAIRAERDGLQREWDLWFTDVGKPEFGLIYSTVPSENGPGPNAP